MPKNYLSSLLDDPALYGGIAGYPRPPEGALSGIAGLFASPPPPPAPTGLFGLARHVPTRPVPSGLAALALADFFEAPRLPSSLWLDWATFKGEWWFLEYAAQVAPDADVAYVIWRSEDGLIVKVGQGNARARLGAHNRDKEILASRGRFGLRASWARVHPHLLDGVERFLGDTLQPLVAERFPRAKPIQVNLPWG